MGLSKLQAGELMLTTTGRGPKKCRTRNQRMQNLNPSGPSIDVKGGNLCEGKPRTTERRGGGCKTCGEKKWL